MYPKQQSFLVLGMSKSGFSATEYLLAKGAETYIYDELDSTRIKENMQTLIRQGAKPVEKESLSLLVDSCDALVLSPGIPIDHPLAVQFKRKGKAVIGETELSARHMRCPIVAVTGTNGKTTTVSLIEKILTTGGYQAHACGNIGTPLIDYVALKEEEIAVAEISSFQLETLGSLCPHVAVVLNITEDHLNRHYSMENYTFLKAKLLKNSTPTEYAVLNYDDMIVRSFAEKTKAKVLWFSVRERVMGAYYENGNLYFGEEKILSAGELFATGLHNIQNALAAIVVAKLMRVSTADIVTALRDFRGIKHRIEKVCEKDGVTYIDDSKGTNVDATFHALQAVKGEKIVLLGGKNKGYDYTKLFEKFKETEVVHAILYGENRFELLKCARRNGFENITLCQSFYLATPIAVMLAKSGQTVLLSPASASFDEFTSYEERGDAFAQIVHTQTNKEENEQTKDTAENEEGGETFDVVANDDNFDENE